MAAFEVGLTSFADTMPDPHTGVAPSHGERLREVVDEIARADAVGLDVYGLGEHHRADMAASAPAVTLAAAAARTERIRLSSAVIVLSSADPVRTFQDFATLDLLSQGRAELLVGRGSFIESFPLFGYSLDDYNELFTEKLELLLAIRDGERVTWEGDFRAPLRDQPVYPRSQQSPLPVWVGVGGTPQSVVRAGHLGLPMALAIIGGDPARFRPFAELYRRSLREAGHDPAQVQLAVHGHGFVADTDEEARELIYPGYAAAMTRLGQERGWPAMNRRQFDWMASPTGSLVVGSPNTVIEKINHWREVLGITRFMLHAATRLPADQMRRSIDLLGSEVAPELRRT